MDAAARGQIQSKVLKDLEQTRFAAESLQMLSGGTVNFIYHGRLKKSLADGTTDVCIKHGEGYLANNPGFRLTPLRCRVEEECLRALSNFAVEGKAALPGEINFLVRTPKFYHFDEQNNTQVQEILPNGKDLKTYILGTYSANTPDAVRPQCLQLGRALGRWLHNFHAWSKTQEGLRRIVAGNTDMRGLKLTINFSWLLDRIEKYPSILGESRDVFEKVRDMATRELEDESRLQVVHGDFWTGNVLIPDHPIQEGSDVTMFVIDWEMAQIGVTNLDLGQIIAELYQLKLFKDITAGLWIVQGFVEAYGAVSDDFAFRTAIQIGAHLITFGTSVEGWGTPEQVETIARTGRDIIVHAWNKDRDWFRTHDLACLFQSN